MVWRGAAIGWMLLVFLSGTGHGQEEDASEPAKLEFLPPPAPGGAVVGPPVSLPESLPAKKGPAIPGRPVPPEDMSHLKGPRPITLPPPRPPIEPREIPRPVRTEPAKAESPILVRRQAGLVVNLETLWNLTQKHQPALQGAQAEKQFEVLTRVRRGYYDFLSLIQEAQQRHGLVAQLEGRLAQARLLLDRERTRVEVVCLELLLADLKVQQVQTQAALQATWGQLTTVVGLPDMGFPESISDHSHAVPDWTLERVTHAALRHAAPPPAPLPPLPAAAKVEPHDKGGWPVLPSTSAEAGPPGTIVLLEAALPWAERKPARLPAGAIAPARAEAIARPQELELHAQVREAWGRFLAAKLHLKRLNEEILPRLKERAELIRKAYQIRAEDANFHDIFLADRAVYQAQGERSQIQRDLWRAVADLQGLMRLEPGAESHTAKK